MQSGARRVKEKADRLDIEDDRTDAGNSDRGYLEFRSVRTQAGQDTPKTYSLHIRERAFAVFGDEGRSARPATQSTTRSSRWPKIVNASPSVYRSKWA